MGRNPGFSVVSTLTLGLGIGAKTAIIQLLDAVRLCSLPVSLPQQLAGLRLRNGTGLRGSVQRAHPVLTNAIWERIRDHRPEAFSGVFAWAQDDFHTAPADGVQHAQGLWVSGEFFHMLGVQPVLGRVYRRGRSTRRRCLRCGDQRGLLAPLSPPVAIVN